MIQAQVKDDVDYFLDITERDFNAEEITSVEKTVLEAYRWQYIVSGVEHPRFSKILSDMITPSQLKRIQSALGSILQ